MLFWLTHEGLRAWRRRSDPVCFFPADAQGLEEFAVYLARTGERRWRLLLDLANEEYAELSLPPNHGLSTFDRRLLLARRLEERYPGRLLRAPLGQPTSGAAPTWQLLSVDDEEIQPWLRLLQARAELADGIHAIGPLALACHLPEANYNGILQILGEQHLRQILVRHGQPCFSRKIALAGDEDPVGRIVEESRQLLQHLHLHRGQPTPERAWIVLPPTLAESLPPTLAAATGIPWSAHSRDSGQWQQEILRALTRAPGANLLPPALRRAARRRCAETLFLGLGALLLAFTLGRYEFERLAAADIQPVPALTDRPQERPATSEEALLSPAGEALLQEMLAAGQASRQALDSLAAWAAMPARCHTLLPVDEWRWHEHRLHLRLRRAETGPSQDENKEEDEEESGETGKSKAAAAQARCLERKPGLPGAWPLRLAREEG